MSARFCPSCGRPVDPSATFCGACGTAMPSPGTAPTFYPATAPLATGATAYSSSAGPLPEGRLSPVDGRAMDSILLASIFGLISAIASFVVPYAVGYSTFSPSTNFASLNVVYGLMGTLGASVVFTLLMFWYFRASFRALAAGDAGLRTSATFTIFAVFGAVIAIGALLWILGQAYQWFQCAGGVMPVPTSCIARGPILAALGLLAVGAVLYLVGWVAVLLGIWRLGVRYNEPLFKIGMVLYIFPLLNIVGLILIIVASRSVRNKLGARGPTAGV